MITSEQRERLDRAFAEFPEDAPPSVSQLRKAAGVGQNVTAAYLQAKRGQPIDMAEPDWDLDTFRPAISTLWIEAAKVARARVDAQVEALIARADAAKLAQAEAEERADDAETRILAAEARVAEAEAEVVRMQSEVAQANDRAARAEATAEFSHQLVSDLRADLRATGLSISVPGRLPGADAGERPIVDKGRTPSDPVDSLVPTDSRGEMTNGQD